MKLSKIENNPFSWGVLAGLTGVLICCSLYFQHFLNIDPCILCIYQRISIMAIFLAAIIGFVLRDLGCFKIIPYMLWIGASCFGLYAASFQWYEVYQVSQNPFYFSQCGQGLEIMFPILESNTILKDLFVAQGICTDIDWSLFGLGMYHYMVVAFSLFTISGITFFLVFLNKQIRFSIKS